MDAHIRALAEQQGGLFLTSQVVAHGICEATPRAWVAAGEAFRLTRGLYLLSTHRASTAAERHLQRARGAHLLMPDAVLSHWTAVLAHGLPVLQVPAAVRLQRPVRRQARRSGFVIDPLREPPVDSAHGPTSPVAVALLDQARLRGLEAGLVSADAALRTAAVSPEELAARAAELRGPRSGLARRTAELADGSIESVGESRLRYVCVMGGIEVVAQATIRGRDGRFVARVDFLVKDTMVVLEFDGRVKYVDGNGRALWHEKQREDALRQLGYSVIRVTWADLGEPQALLARIRATVTRGRSLAG